MDRSSIVSRRASLAVFATVLTATAAGAATLHRMSVSQGSGSEGAQTFLQSSASGSALQGEVSGSSANTAIKLPFGILGEYDASGSTFGTGVLGISTTGYAVAGESTSNQPSILAYSGGTGIGLEATTPANSSAPAIYAEAKGTGYAGYFEADNNVGGYFSSSGEPAVYATATSPAATGLFVNNSTAGQGIFSTTAGGNGGYFASSGNIAESPTGDFIAADAGLRASSQTGGGLLAASLESAGTPTAYAGDGSQFAGAFTESGDGPGLFAYSANDIGAIVTNNDADYPALYVNANAASGSAYEIEAAAGNITTDRANFGVDRAGNVVANGSFTSGSDTFNAVSRNPNADEMTYATQSAEATIEDFGNARMTDGRAAVALAPDFQKTIDTASRYLVFLTPDGDTNGLYVASRSPGGFVVREIHGGRSTLDFDYRIVARPWGSRMARLPHEPEMLRHPELAKLHHPADATALARVRTYVAKIEATQPKAPQIKRYTPPPLHRLTLPGAPSR